MGITIIHRVAVYNAIALVVNVIALAVIAAVAVWSGRIRPSAAMRARYGRRVLFRAGLPIWGARVPGILPAHGELLREKRRRRTIVLGVLMVCLGIKVLTSMLIRWDGERIIREVESHARETGDPATRH
jgi:hypothetical protein